LERPERIEAPQRGGGEMDNSHEFEIYVSKLKRQNRQIEGLIAILSEFPKNMATSSELLRCTFKMSDAIGVMESSVRNLAAITFVKDGG